MPISSNLVTATQTRIDALTSSCCANDFALAATAATEMSCYDSNRKVSVATVNDLPSTETTGIGPGHIVFVESINVPVMSYEEGWMGLDRRILRKDKPDKILLSWGFGTYGALGTGNTTNQSSPVTTAGGGTTWCQVSGGYYHVFGIKTDGTLWAWGRNSWGYLGTGDVTNQSSPVTTAGGGTTWCQASGGYTTSAGVKTDGTLWTWGNGGYGRLGTGGTTSRSSPGTTAGGGTNWCKVNVNWNHTNALKLDGTLWAWGKNEYGQLGTSDTTNYSSPGTTAGGGTNWCSIASSMASFSSAAIKTDGTLWTWGANNFYQLGTGDTTSRSSPGTTVGGGTNWCSVVIGGYHSAAIKTDGTLWTWGRNEQYGQLGIGNTNQVNASPVTTAGGGTTWCQVSKNFYHSAAIKTDGTLWTWGYNVYCQLGTGDATHRSSPVTTAGGGTTWICSATTGLSTSAIKLSY